MKMGMEIMDRLRVAVSSVGRGFVGRALPTLGIALLVACGGGGEGTQPPLDALAGYSSDTSDVSSLPEARIAIDGAFATSLLCADCHANKATSDALRDGAGRPVAPFDLWRSSMLSHAVRDPLWRAVVSVEMESTPAEAEAIEAVCFSCHGAMASREGELDGVEPTLGLVYEDGDRAQITLDGVSCTACHQITSTGLGTEDSYTGQFELNVRREAYGPHASPFEMPMRTSTGYRPVQAAHIDESALCGSCHTVITETLDEEGDPVGTHFAEQTSYLEWRNSVFNDEVAAPTESAASCQDCHMPTVSEDGVPIQTVISTKPVMGSGGGRGGARRRTRNRWGGGGMELSDRSPFGRHVLVGGNTAVPLMFLANPDELRPNASSEDLEATIQATRQALRHDTARLSVLGSERVGDELRIRLRVENLTGHKLPTGIPVRRMWIRVRVRDADGNTVFQSGAYDTAGRILGADGTPLASEAAAGPTELHRDRIAIGDQVQIYESLMADADGAPTFRLMRAASHRKDNRLLPLGWSSDHADAARTAPQGEATEDANFTAGEDTVAYEFDAPASEGPYRLEASLLYQAIAQRFAAELLEFSTPEVEALDRYLTPVVRAPEEIATVSRNLP